MKYYEFHIYPERQIIKETIFDFWTKEVAEKYYLDFIAASKPLMKKPWAKIVNLNDWRLLAVDAFPFVSNHLKWAMDNGMKFSVNILSENALSKVQIKRLLKESGTSDYTQICENEKEALEFLNKNGF